MNACKKIVHSTGTVQYRCTVDDEIAQINCEHYKRPNDTFKWCAHNRNIDGGITDDCACREAQIAANKEKQ